MPFKLGDESKIKSLESAVGEKVRLKANGARILVVDDNSMNLKVAFRMLGLFEILPVLVESGREAIAAVQESNYDIVFMDHMMPVMDGIEATAEIRALGGKFADLPIIALTANATYGVRDMFIKAGMNDYLSKPIELDTLNDILRKWLPVTKFVETDGLVTPPIEIIADNLPGLATGATMGAAGDDFWYAVSRIEYINAEIGKNRVAGIEEMYREMLELLHGRLDADTVRLEEFLDHGDLQNFSILVHGLKSSLSTVGAMGLSQTAFELESASKEGNENFCKAKLPGFLEDLRELNWQIVELCSGRASVGADDGDQPTTRKSPDDNVLRDLVATAHHAVDLYNGDAALVAIDELLSYDFDVKITEILRKAKAAVKNFEFAEAAELLRGLEG